MMSESVDSLTPTEREKEMAEIKNLFDQLDGFLEVLNQVSESNDAKCETHKLSLRALQEISQCFYEVQKAYVYMANVISLITWQVDEAEFHDQLQKSLQEIEREWDELERKLEASEDSPRNVFKPVVINIKKPE